MKYASKIKLYIVQSVLLLTVFSTSFAQANDLFIEKYDEATGKWGYVSPLCEWVIAPQYDSVDPFRGNYAIVRINDDQFIIDTAGKFVIPFGYDYEDGMDGWFYGGKDTGIILAFGDDGVGFFNVTNGFFSGTIYSAVGGAPDTPYPELIPVCNDQFLWGYVNAQTGELLIPYQFLDANCFIDGSALTLQYDSTIGQLVDVYIDNKGNPIDSLPQIMSEER